MRNLARLAAAAGFFTIVWCHAASAARLRPPNPPLPICDDEVVYGTAVVDFNLRAFALRGTSYVFVVSEDVPLDAIDGQQIRVEIAPDCNVRELHVIGSDDDAIL